MGHCGDWGGRGDGIALSFERMGKEGLNFDRPMGSKKVKNLAVHP